MISHVSQMKKLNKFLKIYLLDVDLFINFLTIDTTKDNKSINNFDEIL